MPFYQPDETVSSILEFPASKLDSQINLSR